MTNVAVYPGSFNPWHDGHTDILRKSLKCFDHIVIAIGQNPEKELGLETEARAKRLEAKLSDFKENVTCYVFEGLLVNFVKNLNDSISPQQRVKAVIRGLRNGHDLQYEMNQQYWNEDLGLTVPVAYFICDRTLSHISSSMVKAVRKIESEVRQTT